MFYIFLIKLHALYVGVLLTFDFFSVFIMVDNVASAPAMGPVDQEQEVPTLAEAKNARLKDRLDELKPRSRLCGATPSPGERHPMEGGRPLQFANQLLGSGGPRTLLLLQEAISLGPRAPCARHYSKKETIWSLAF